MNLLPPTKVTPIDFVKPMINVGATLDIPTGSFLIGKHNEAILNGGLGYVNGVVGIGNNFKSAIIDYMALSAMSKILQTTNTRLETYDTEINIHEGDKATKSKRHTMLKDRDLSAEGIWTITDKSKHAGNKWFELHKEWLNEKNKVGGKLTFDTPFLDRDGKSLFKLKLPTFQQIDSITDFSTDDVENIKDKFEIGDAGRNMVHMRQGLSKHAVLSELPTLAINAAHYYLITGQVGKDIPMGGGPFGPPPTVKLTYLKHGDKIKGTTDKFFFLLNSCWHSIGAKPFINQGTKGPEYPRNAEDDAAYDKDLNTVSIQQLRSKSGQTGITLELIASQQEGILPTLTEFHFIKENDRFGLGGSNSHYFLDILPDVKLTRPTVRSKIDTDSKLCRAINITSEIAQMYVFWNSMDRSLLSKPSELYEDLKNQGYDWDVLLNTRGYWLLNNDEHKVPFLSSMDILRMHSKFLNTPKAYFPYWLNEDKKSIKKEFIF